MTGDGNDTYSGGLVGDSDSVGDVVIDIEIIVIVH